MQRLILINENYDGLDEIFNKYENYIADMVRSHTKTYWVKLGKFYVTKFNPDVVTYEDYILKTSNHPFIRPLSKYELLQVATKLSGLNILTENDYKIVKTVDKGMLGIVFMPMEETKVQEVVRLIEE